MNASTTYTPPTHPRQWLPAKIELSTWEQIEPWYQKLEAREIHSAADLEQWLFDSGELNAVVNQVGVERHIAYTCQTDDPAREEAHLAYVREIEPNLKEVRNSLRNLYLDSPFRLELDRDRYFVFDRLEENRRTLFREANIPRETELAELEQQYQKVIGGMTVEFRGKTYTPAQMAPFLEETDRELRHEAWKLVADRRLQDRDRLDDLFDHMVALRHEIAIEAGFPTFVEYAYKLRDRFDYGVPEAVAFQEAIERTVVPLASQLHEQRMALLGLEELRPWDLSVDPDGFAPLRPYDDPDKLAAGSEAIFRDVDPELGAQFAFMREKGLLDLANRKGKAPGGYQTTLESDRLPFIFMNAVGMDGDVRTLLHEGGHAFHSLAAREEPLAAYREAPIEFCEVASMSMELLGARKLEMFYGKEDADRSYQQLLEGIVLILPWIATVDAFQHWIYANPKHSRQERRAAWTKLVARFGGLVDWSGLEEVRESTWHRQLHIFLYPFYYIEYGIAQLGALQVWKNAMSDRAEAVKAYRRGLALGGSRPLPELFEGAGIKFDFSERTLGPLLETVGKELRKL
jgi:oligoendopeptidase F